MRSCNVLFALAILNVLAISRPLVFGQSTAAFSVRNTDETFSAIHTALGQAADSALNSTPVTEPVANSGSTKPHTLQVASAKPPDSRFKAGRIDTLLPLIQPILAREGLPDELAAVVDVESSGNPLALSPKGARGLWQLMPATARRYGLRVDSHSDERIDVEKSTVGAARYLHDLYTQFGSWPLALAAYNTGEQTLQRAINRAGSNEFKTLSLLGYLPAETRQYVPAVLGAMGLPPLPDSKRSNVPPRAIFVYALSTQ
jgi:soluble lytic murein transglycosylase-like protein